ncbi:MAG: amidohydrolase family protein [Desulfobacterales bacterium]|nr:MAG: amidohydrolase family protein [Desulfobacterales bacterium]
MKTLFAVLSTLAMLVMLALPAAAIDIPSEVTLFRNVNIFDGQNEKPLEGYDVLVVKNLIEKIDKNIQLSNTYEIDLKTGGYKPITSGGMCDFTTTEPKVMVYEPEKMVKKEVKVNVIDGKGRTLMPGLIDAHWHVLFNSVPIPELLSSDFAHLTIVGMKSAEGTLMRGFTTVRDVGGNPFSIKKAIDRGIYPGPRIYPSGPMISPTSGHSDGRPYTAVPTEDPDALSYLERNAVLMRADGVAQMRLRVREALRMGASQIKISTGGGVSSLYDPLDVTEYSEEEVKAAVEEADNFGTYVAAHTFTDRATQMAINAGVKTVEHGFLLSEETLKMMKEKGVWLSIQPLLNDEDAFTFPDPISTAKWIEVTDGTDRVYSSAKKLGVKIAFGTDILFDPKLGPKHGKFLTKLKNWFTPYEALKIATSTNAELLKMCGPRDPYRGELGVVKAGALADLILVDGNPLENLDLVADPAKNFVMIMKEGKIYKNTIK